MEAFSIYNLPKGVMKVLSRLDSWSRTQCHQPAVRSRVENIFPPDRSGSWCVSPLRTCFNGCGSMHIQWTPDFLVAMTTLLTHAEGSSTLARTPRLSSQSGTALSFSFRAVKTQREDCFCFVRVAFSSICRCAIPGRVPRSFKNSHAWHQTSSSTVSILLMSFFAWLSPWRWNCDEIILMHSY